MEWSLPAKLKAKCEASPAASSAPSPTPSAGQAPASTERTCPARTLINKCKINCETTSCKGNVFGNANSLDISVGLDGQITTWNLGKGAEGASCNIKCPKADNLDETTKCSLNAEGKMEWSLPAKLKAKCEASPAESSAPSAGQAPASTERTCPARTLINKCKINCETTSCKGNVFGNANGLDTSIGLDGQITTWNLGKGAE